MAGTPLVQGDTYTIDKLGLAPDLAGSEAPNDNAAEAVTLHEVQGVYDIERFTIAD